ncbi:MAG: endopeptidase La [Firmicutes bacterium]|nr:endopeptidase La [Bacillota bacterium]MDY5336004.1 endopeptidase La [Bacilli bacterium]
MTQTNLPILYLRDVVLLPFNDIRLEFSNDIDKKILNIAESNYDGYVLLINLNDPLEEEPDYNTLPDIGILGKIKSKIDLPNGITRVVMTGIDRVEIVSINNNNDFLSAFVISTKEYDYNEVEASALRRVLYRKLDEYIDISPYMSNTVIGRITEVKNISKLSDIIVSELPLEYNEVLKYVSITNPMNRIREITLDLSKEIETVRLENEIEDNLKVKLEEEQKEYMLREKIKLIKEELGEVDLKDADIDKIRNKMNSLDLPENIIKRLNEEIDRYSLTSSASPEVTTIRTYIDWLLCLPWNKLSKDNTDVKKITEVLNNSHFGLESVKKRIIEYIAVKKKTNTSNSPIICLVGPPGVGKTSLASSIAKALNKDFVKVSLGGINDEAEILGHRRTYVGASPGKIIQQMKKANTSNPVFLIDEVDKLTKDYKGDPASALLEILDKEQNDKFCDNYIEEEFDLSNVMFILTANNIGGIPAPLLDRLEIIELSSYTIYEKLNIAKYHLIPDLLNEYKVKNIKFTDSAIQKIITYYTKEAGARDLYRQIDSIIRKAIINNDKSSKIVIDNGDVEAYLGATKYNITINDTNTKTGIVNGLAYTMYGGNILKVTCTLYPGKGNVTLTGALGDVIKESIYIALSYIKANNTMFKIDYKIFEEVDFHFHIEEGSIPKDGPSAGVTIVTAILSLLKNKIIPNNVSMTGEITLRGKILPVGGLKEKLIAATTNGIDTVYLPLESSKEFSLLPSEVRDNLNIILVEDYEDVYKSLFK